MVSNRSEENTRETEASTLLFAVNQPWERLKLLMLEWTSRGHPWGSCSPHTAGIKWSVSKLYLVLVLRLGEPITCATSVREEETETSSTVGGSVFSKFSHYSAQFTIVWLARCQKIMHTCRVGMDGRFQILFDRSQVHYIKDKWKKKTCTDRQVGNISVKLGRQG